MKIRNLRLEKSPSRIKACATFNWEEADRPEFEMFFETDIRFESAFELNPHAFLLAGIYPAMCLGEKRIHIEGAICPDLKEGLNVAAGWISHWYEGHRPEIRIETADSFRTRTYFGPRQRAQMISCGIDSLFTLRKNRQNYPADHPGFIRAGLFIYGFDMGNTEETYGSQGPVYERVRSVLAEITDELNLDIIPVYTNTRHLLVDRWMFKYQGHSAALAAAAHCFSPRFDSVLIPSSGTYFNLQPWGSHPLLDPQYSSADMRIVYDGLQYSRLDKVREIVQWETAMKHLRVCYLNEETSGNCATCPKCVNAMAGLLVAGGLDRAQSFPQKNLPASLMRKIRPGAMMDHDGHFPELIEPLKAMGRHDLARIIRWKLFQYKLIYGQGGNGGFVKQMKHLDRTKLNGILYRLYVKLVS
jgi:hypothetical protein